jgi:hypothetical protein
MKLLRLVIGWTIASLVEKGRAAHSFIELSAESLVKDRTLRQKRLVDEDLSKGSVPWVLRYQSELHSLRS